MKTGGWLKLSLTALLTAWLVNCGPGSGEIEFDIEEVLSKPKTYVGSDVCRYCHLEHYDSWKTTLHSRTIQDVTKNLYPQSRRNKVHHGHAVETRVSGR
jgi:hypothetical protein